MSVASVHPPIPGHLRKFKFGMNIYDVRRPGERAVFQRWYSHPTAVVAQVKFKGEACVSYIQAEHIQMPEKRKPPKNRNTGQFWNERYGERVASIARKTGVPPSHVKAVLQAAGVAI